MTVNLYSLCGRGSQKHGGRQAGVGECVWERWAVNNLRLSLASDTPSKCFLVNNAGCCDWESPMIEHRYFVHNIAFIRELKHWKLFFMVFIPWSEINIWINSYVHSNYGFETHDHARLVKESDWLNLNLGQTWEIIWLAGLKFSSDLYQNQIGWTWIFEVYVLLFIKYKFIS